MHEKKELNKEGLKKVTGGIGFDMPVVAVKYKDSEDGLTLSHNLGNVMFPEKEAKDWCKTNNKIYVGYEFDDISTNIYDAQTLLNSLSANQ